MESDNEYISELIFKHLVQNLSVSEEQELKQWLTDSENKRQFDQIVDVQTISEDFDRYNQFKPENNWKRLERQISAPKKIKKWLAYAAVIFIPLGLSLSALYLNYDSYVESKIELVTAFSEVECVVLDTGNGQQYDITNKDTLMHLNNVKVGIVDNMIKYDTKLQNVTSEIKYNTLKIPRGMQYELVLADNTKVWLNSETEFKYPVSFSSEHRQVYLINGEAFFDVQKDKERPFVVHFKESKVKVLGTKFNIKSYQNEALKLITLEEGSVIVENENKRIKLKPNQQAILSKLNEEIQIKQVDACIYGSWKRGVLNYKNEELSAIINDLQRHYKIKVFYQNQKIKNKRFSISLNAKDSIHEILELMELTEKVAFELKGNNLIVRTK